MPVGNPLVRPYDPSRPYDVFKGTDIDPRTVVAPVQNLPGTQNPNLLQLRALQTMAESTGNTIMLGVQPAPVAGVVKNGERARKETPEP